MLCSKCHVREVMPIPNKSLPSVKVITQKGTETGFTFLHPTTPGDLCYYCTKQEKGAFMVEDDFYHRGNLVNSHNDKCNPHRFMSTSKEEFSG